MFHQRRSAAAALCALAFVVPLAAGAQPEGKFTSAKLTTRGTTTSAVAGPGLVTVRVYVKANGSVGVTAVNRSSNPADNAAALEIARTSHYVAATLDRKPISSYFTYVLEFSSAGAVAVREAGFAAATLEHAAALVRDGRYAAAKEVLGTFLSTSPDDQQANLLLAAADSFTSDYVAAAAAYDKAGTIPDSYKSLAGQAYTKSANDAFQAKNYAAAIALSGKSIAINGNVDAYNTRGTAELETQQYDAAIADLEKARALVGSASAHAQAVVIANLGAAYIASGQLARGVELAKLVQTLDPSVTIVQEAIFQQQVNKASAAAQGGDFATAAQILDETAGEAPKYAVVLYTASATNLAKVAKPDWKAVKAEADKALAVDPNNVEANYAAGYALSQQNQIKEANPYFIRAQTAIKNGAKVSDPSLPAKIDNAVKQTGGGN